MTGKCQASDITQINPLEFTIINSRAMTLSMAFTRAVIDEMSLPQLFPVGGAGVGGSGYKCRGGVNK